MAGSKSSVTGEDFYGAYEAQEVAQKHAMELNMQTVPSLNITYTEVWLELVGFLTQHRSGSAKIFLKKTS